MGTQLEIRNEKFFRLIALVARGSMICLLLTMAPASLLASNDNRGLCAEAIPTALNTTQIVDFHTRPEAVSFRLDIAYGGVLALEVSDLAQGLLEPKIQLIGDDCLDSTVGSLSYVEHSNNRSIVRVNTPGTYFVSVTTNSDLEGGVYRFKAGFSEASPLQIKHLRPGLDARREWQDKIEEWEEDDVSLTTGGTAQPPSVENIEEWEEDDVSEKHSSNIWQRSPALGTAGFAVVEVTEPGVLELEAAGADLIALLHKAHPKSARGAVADTKFLGPAAAPRIVVDAGIYHLRWRTLSPTVANPTLGASLFPVCGLAEPDDHGDSLACASSVGLGSTVPAEIHKSSAADIDMFSFVLTKHENVIIESQGGTDTYGQLQDESGVRLAADDDNGSGTNFRIVETLCPGRYFVKVEGVGASEGLYILDLASGFSGTDTSVALD